MKQPLLAVVGPTASGKTALAVELAKIYGGEVISADSMQIYKGMSIATAKPDAEEMQGVPHHLIDFLNPSDSFSVADYVTCAKAKIAEISARGRLPIVCGGTGLYINSLIDNIKFDDTCSNTEIRDELYKIAREQGNKRLLEMLFELDPETAKALHENNLNRIVRAIEVFKVTGIPLSQHKINSRLEKSPFNTCVIGLTCEDRQKLYDKINLRVDIMLKNGLVEECKEVYEKHFLKTAHQAIGYKELIPYFKGEQSLEQCVNKIKQETRRYAKRQLTWFRRDPRINWIFTDNFESQKKIIEKAQEIVAFSEIL